MKAIILARVSKEDQLEGASIPAQLARSQEYAKRKELEILKEYQFDESSLKEHRVKFEEVLKDIRASKDPIALVVETVDRLQRSFKESVVLDEFRKNGTRNPFHPRGFDLAQELEQFRASTLGFGRFRGSKLCPPIER